jgi:Domain of unknown function (DUF5615)
VLRFLIDECVSEHVAEAIRDWNAQNPLQTIQFLSVGDPPDLPKGSADPNILLWAEANNYLVLTVDYRTMPVHLADHLAAGRHIAGILSVRPATWTHAVVEDLVMIAVAGAADDYYDTIQYIPL